MHGHTFTAVDNSVLDRDLDPYELAVYMAVARQDYAGPGGRQPLSQPDLMARAHLKERRGRAALTALRRMGLVVITATSGHRTVYQRGTGTAQTAENSAPDAEINSAPRAEIMRNLAPRAEIKSAPDAEFAPMSAGDAEKNSARGAGNSARGAETTLLRTKDNEDSAPHGAGDAPSRPAPPRPAQKHPSHAPGHEAATGSAEQAESEQAPRVAAAPPSEESNVPQPAPARQKQQHEPPEEPWETAVLAGLCAVVGWQTIGVETRRKWRAAVAPLAGCAEEERRRFCGWLGSNGYWAGKGFHLAGQLRLECEAFVSAGCPQSKPPPRTSPPGGNGRARASPVPPAVQAERDAILAARRQKHLAKYGNLDWFE